MNKPRIKETHRWLYQYSDLFLVRCPRCDKRAEVVLRERPSDPEWPRKPNDFARLLWLPRRLVCEHCGYVKDLDKRTASLGAPHDWYFGQPLWLQIQCCGEVLWAINERHLDFLEEYVRAELREGYSQLSSRLPTWIKSAKNRDELLKCIRKLREML